VALASACGGGEGPAGAPPPEVLVATAREGAVPDRREYVGTVRAVKSVDVRARVRGYLLEQRYEEGQHVDEGDVLFLIEPSTYEVALAVAKGDLARAQATAARAQADFTRSSELFQSKVVSQAELDARRAERDAALAEVESARATVSAAELDLSYCTVLAPFAGRMGRRLVDPGNLVGESGQDTVLARLVQVDPIHVDFAVPELDRREAASAAAAQGASGAESSGIPVSLVLGDGTPYTHTGELDYVDPTVDPLRGTVAMRALVPNPDDVLKPGEFVRVVATFPERKGAILVPQRAVLDEQGGNYVLVVKGDDSVESRRVSLGVASDGMQQILEGLRAGERVITDGVQKARPGQKVVPKPARVTALGDLPRATAPCRRGDHLVEGARETRTECGEVRHGRAIGVDADVEPTVVAVERHAHRALGGGGREGVARRDARAGQVARLHDPGHVGDDQVHRPAARPRDGAIEGARQHREHLGQRREEECRRVGLAFLHAPMDLREAHGDVALRDRELHVHTGRPVARGGRQSLVRARPQIDGHERAHLGDVAVPVRDVPFAHRSRHGGEQHVDHLAPESAARLAQGLEGHVDAGQMAGAPEAPERRGRGVADVVEHGTHDARCREEARGPGEGRPAGAPQGAASIRRLDETAPKGIAQLLAGVGLLPGAEWGIRNDGDGRRVAARIGEGREDGVAAHAIRHRVVQPEEDGRAGARAVELDQLPERARPVEGSLVDGADGAEQVIERRMRGVPVLVRQRVAPDVEVEVEGRVVLPARARQIEGRVDDPLAQARHRLDRAPDGRAQLLRMGPLIEQQQHGHRRPLARLVRVPEGEVLSREGLRGRASHRAPSSGRAACPGRCRSGGVPFASTDLESSSRVTRAARISER
jgi:RND family efflux transporter MFP subunit